MSVDNYEMAIALTEKIKQNLPISAQPTKELVNNSKKQGATLQSQQTLIIDSVVYTGDEGGICCAIKLEGGSKSLLVASITHLVIDPTHPLAPEIQAYQQQRIRALKVQNSRSFMSEMGRLSASPKRKKQGGFGFKK
jgi:hypothetical protein